jgi:hypothetical protein
MQDDIDALIAKARISDTLDRLNCHLLIGALAAALARLREENARLRDATVQAMGQFMFYSGEHDRKCTADGDAKSKVNREWADKLRAALAPSDHIGDAGDMVAGDRGGAPLEPNLLQAPK